MILFGILNIIKCAFRRKLAAAVGRIGVSPAQPANRIIQEILKLHENLPIFAVKTNPVMTHIKHYSMIPFSMNTSFAATIPLIAFGKPQ